MLSSVLSVMPILEPVIVRIMVMVRPDAVIRCETISVLISACDYVPA